MGTPVNSAAGGAFVIDYDEMTDFGFRMQSQVSTWGEQLGAIRDQLEVITGMDSFKGRAAESVKSYLSEIHYVILFSLGDILNELYTRFLLYKDGYYSTIDSNNHAKLSETVLTDSIQAFSASWADFEASNVRIHNTADSIHDIMNAYPPEAYGVLDAYSMVLEKLKNLQTDVTGYESEHLAGDFTNLDALVSSLRTFIAEYQAKDNHSVASYVTGSIASSVSLGALGEALFCSGSDREFLAGAVEAANLREQARFEVLQAEWAKEREEQGWLNLLVGGLIVVGGIFCIVATAGLATPLVVAGAIAGSATVIYGASNMVAAAQDIYYGAHGDYSTTAFNPMRDTIFEWVFGPEGKQQAWDTFGTVAIAASTVMTLGAGAISASSAAANAGTSVFRAVGVYGAKTAVSIGAGYLGGVGAKEAALFFGADETVANIFGVIGGTTAGIATGIGAQRIDQAYNLSGFYQPVIEPVIEPVAEPKPPDLPEFDNKTTHGVLRTADGQDIPFQSGNADPRYSNYVSASHVEGKAALYMGENGITDATLYTNNTNGTCGFCDKMLSTLLPEGSQMTVVPPTNAVANNASAVAVPKTYVGNSAIPKVNPKFIIP
ncbi:MAG: hypothetical protein LBG68_05045 [Coriobacteriales bacterium]|jgi:hypothetical protein|nr:hypothetical protein [Coriobacteriales bacterium]